MIALGHSALVRLSHLAAIIDSGSAYGLLTEREASLWARCSNRKRRLEFLGGRVAGKLAANTHRVSIGQKPKAWDAIDILPQSSGAPVCQFNDGSRFSISISHSSECALALVSSTDYAVAIDVEGPSSRVRLIGEMFHALELCWLRNIEDARTVWTVKEACGKLIGTGLQGNPESIITVRLNNNLWLIPPRWMNIPAHSIFASGRWGRLTLSVGFQSGFHTLKR